MIVNYLNVGGPGNIPPTVNQTQNVYSINVSLSPQSTLDTSQAITHNIGFTTQISQGRPYVNFQPLDALAQLSNWFVASQGGNFLVVGRAGTTAGIDTANAQVIVGISHPHSLVR